LANAAIGAGVTMYEHTPALDISGERTVRIRTAQGSVSTQQVVMCCNAYVGTLSRSLEQRIMSVGTYIVATEPLGEQRITSLVRRNVSVADTNFILDYFRRSADHRLLFGGRVSYSGRDFVDTAAATRKRMIQVFPQLHDTQIEYSWGGMLDITLNRAPDFGRVQNNIYYLQGFSGHGMALAGLAGKLVAETIAGQAERFDLYTRLQHRPFPGGALLRTPALVLAMLWYRLRDLL
jgi:gamma-glutamylputrescine oxidase